MTGNKRFLVGVSWVGLCLGGAALGTWLAFALFIPSGRGETVFHGFVVLIGLIGGIYLGQAVWKRLVRRCGWLEGEVGRDVNDSDR